MILISSSKAALELSSSWRKLCSVMRTIKILAYRNRHSARAGNVIEVEIGQKIE